MILSHKYKSLRLLFFIPVLAVLALIGFIYYQFVVRYAWEVIFLGSGTGGYRVVAGVQLVIFHMIVVPLLASYLRCVFTHPGGIPESFLQHAETLARERHAALAQQREATLAEAAAAVAAGADVDSDASLDGPPPPPPLPYKLCRTCQVPKPPRSHHCPACNICVLKMDHHCPWVGNCVGYANHKYFVQFVSYAAVGTLFVGFSLVAPMLGKAQDVGFVHKSAPFGIFICAILGFSLGLTLCGFSAFHIYLIRNNRTTFEMAGERWELEQLARFNLGATRNLEQVLGRSRWRWFMPVPADGVVGDGCHWPWMQSDENSQRHEVFTGPAGTAGSGAAFVNSDRRVTRVKGATAARGAVELSGVTVAVSDDGSGSVGSSDALVAHTV